MLGFDEYIESHGDGLQILRYNLTTAYSTFVCLFVGMLEYRLSVSECDSMESFHRLLFSFCIITVPHMDYLDLDKKLQHDYDSSKKGGNRFATILLYMTDLSEKDGGETVFIDAWPSGQREEDHKPLETVRI